MSNVELYLWPQFSHSFLEVCGLFHLMLLTKAKKQLKDEVAIARGFSQINSLPFVLSQIFAIGK